MKARIFFILICLNLSVFAQFSTLGTTFHFAFLQNRVDSNGAPTNGYQSYTSAYIHIANTTTTLANVNIDFNGNPVYYKINSVTGIPVTGNMFSFNIDPDSSVTVQIIPYDSITVINNGSLSTIYDARVFQAMNNFQIQHKMISINSINNVPLTVFAESTQPNSRDVSMILPDNALGVMYYAFSTNPYPLEHPISWTGGGNINLGGPSEALILSIHDSTVVNLILPNDVTSLESVNSNVDATGNDTVYGGTYYTVTLNYGELFQMQSDSFSLTGSCFYANYPFAVFSGNMANRYNYSSSYFYDFDYIYEQMLSIKNWGRKYVVSYLYDNKPEFIKIIPMYNNTTININGTPYILDSGEEQTFQLDDGQTMYIDATNPICVTQITSSSKYSGGHHTINDPSMVMITPLTQPIEDIIISIPITTPNTLDCNNVSKTDYINIVTATSNTDSIIVNDFINPASNITSYPGLVVDWTPVTSNPAYSYAIVDVTNFSTVSAKSIKLYDISTNKTGFNAIVSGFNCAEAYSYNAGINVTEITSNNPQFIQRNEINIFPNPAKSEVYISLTNKETIKAITVLNIKGEEVLKTTKEKSDYSLNVTKLTDGIYFVKVITNKSVYVKKLEILH